MHHRCHWYRAVNIANFASVNDIDTGEAPKKSNISANNRKKSKSFLGMSPGPRRNSLKKKNRGKKSRGTVPLRYRLPQKRGKDSDVGGGVGVDRVRYPTILGHLHDVCLGSLLATPAATAVSALPVKWSLPLLCKRLPCLRNEMKKDRRLGKDPLVACSLSSQQPTVMYLGKGLEDLRVVGERSTASRRASQPQSPSTGSGGRHSRDCNLLAPQLDWEIFNQQAYSKHRVWQDI
jgi:hypothetical protein